MKKLIAALVLSLVGCHGCQRTTSGPAPAVSHDVVAMDSLPTPPPGTAVVPNQVPPTVEAAAPVPAPRRILIIGDSEACAVAPQVKKAKLPTDTVDVECKGGTVVQYWGAQGHFKAALAKHPKPDVVVIFLGTNHYWQKETPPVAPVLDLVRENGLKCVWVGNTAVKGKKWAINGLIREAVTPTCDYFDTEEADIPLWDGVHPDPTAALKWLQAVWPTIPLKYEDTHD